MSDVIQSPSAPAYPLLGLHFKLELLGSQVEGSEASVSDDAVFQEATGISMKLDKESYREDGENRFTHRLPTGVTHEPLKLIRGLMAKDGPITQWCRAALQGNFTTPIQPQALSLKLVEVRGTGALATEQILKVWWLDRAWPLRWEVSGLNASNERILVETLELSYADFQQGKTGNRSS